MTDPAVDRRAQVDRACESTNRLIALLGELAGSDQKPPLGEIPEWHGRMADAYQQKLNQVVAAATRLQDLSRAQLDRLHALRDELHAASDADPAPARTEPTTPGGMND